MKAVYYATLLLGTAALAGLATMPLWHPRAPIVLVPARSQTADAVEWEDPYGSGRTAESQAYIDEHGYGYAPCMDDGSCDYGGGSLKDAPPYAYGSDDGYYGTYDYYDEYAFDTVEYPSYGRQTSTYVASGLSQVPMILANTFSPQTASWYPSYTTNTSYVPVQQPGTQMYTYSQPMQSGAPYQTSQQISTSYSYSSGGPSYVPSPQTVQQGTVQVSAPVTVTSAYTIAQPVQTTQAGFYATSRPIQVTVASARGQSTVSGTVSGPALPSCSISAKPVRIAAGATSTISWKTSDADTATVDPLGSVALVGSTTVRIATTTTFILKTTGQTGTSTCSVKVTIDPTMCLPGCPPGYICTPVSGGAAAPAPAATAATTTAKKGFWSWLGF